VQVGAFTQEANASKLAASLRLENFPSFVTTSTNRVLYLVHMGPYPDEKSARRAVGEVRKRGQKPFILYPDVAEASN
jgi:cell division septation protein DedD